MKWFCSAKGAHAGITLPLEKYPVSERGGLIIPSGVLLIEKKGAFKWLQILF
jgi:hypothetical protein